MGNMSDFRDIMTNCYPNIDTTKLESHIFRMYDRDNNGHIDFREFMMVLYVLSTGTPEDCLRQIFRIFDVSNTGTLSHKDMSHIIKDFCLLQDHEALAAQAIKEMVRGTSECEVTEEAFIKACLNKEGITEMLALKVVDVIYDFKTHYFNTA